MDSILKQKITDDGQKFYHQIMRQQRDKFLKETDKYLLQDFPITPENLIKIKEYRKALRDFSNNDFIIADFPF